MADKKLKLSALSLAVLFSLLIAVPFLDKPVHWDDWVFITGANRLSEHPFNALNGRIELFGRKIPFSMGTHTPFLFPYLAFVRFLTGGFDETTAHIFYLPFIALAAISIFFLARRFLPGRRGNDTRCAYLALLALATPAFMVSSQALMADMPTMAFFLASLACYIYAVDHNRIKYLVPASLLCALAVLSSYQGAFVFVVLFLYTVLNKKRVALFFAVCLFPLFALGVWFFIVGKAAGQFHLFNAFFWGGLREQFSPAKIIDTFVGFICVIGAATVFPLALFFLSPRPGKSFLFYVFLVLANVYFYFTRISDYPLVQKMTFTIFFSAGCIVLHRVCRVLGKAAGSRPGPAGSSPADKDSIFISLWFFGFLGAAVLLLPQGISRYFLIALFPLVVIFARGIRGKFFLPLTLLATLIMGFFVSVADYRIALADSRAASRLTGALYPKKIRYAGEFGFRYYMERYRHRYFLSETERLEPDEVFVEDDRYPKLKISSALKMNLKKAGSLAYHDRWPVTVSSRTDKADFYSSANGYGFLPYAFTAKNILASFTIYEYADSGNLRRLPLKSAAAFDSRKAKPLDEGLFLLDWCLNKTEFRQGDGFILDLKLLLAKPPRRDFYTRLFLQNPCRKILLSHDPWGGQVNLEGNTPAVFSETYTIHDLSRDFFPGEYEIYLEAVPAGNTNAGVDDFDPAAGRALKLGAFTIKPRVYAAGPYPLGRPGYLPGFRLPGLRATFALSRGYRVEIPVSAAHRASSLGMISFLAYGAGIKDGDAAARVIVLDRDGGRHRFFIRAGMETADWSIDSPAYEKDTYRHKKTKIYNSWPEYHKGQFFWAYRYNAKFVFTKPVIPIKIIVEYLNDTGVLVVDDLFLSRS